MLRTNALFSSLTSHKSHSLEGLHNANKSTTPSIKHQAISHTSTGQAPAIPTTLSLFLTSTSSLCHPDFAYLFFFWLLYFLLVHTFCSFLLPSLNFTHISTPLQTATTQGTTFLQSSFFFAFFEVKLFIFSRLLMEWMCSALTYSHTIFPTFFPTSFFSSEEVWTSTFDNTKTTPRFLRAAAVYFNKSFFFLQPFTFSPAAAQPHYQSVRLFSNWNFNYF